MKKNILVVAILLMLSTFVTLINSCASTASINDKSGAQFWGENCQRCHNAPSPSVFSDNQWGVIGRHMQLRANLTSVEVKKVVEFLQSAN